MESEHEDEPLNAQPSKRRAVARSAYVEVPSKPNKTQVRIALSMDLLCNFILTHGDPATDGKIPAKGKG